jgi:hypothetical protein
MNEEQKKAFESAAKPLMKYLAENHNPHTSIILTSSECEILEGIQSIVTEEFIKD